MQRAFALATLLLSLTIFGCPPAAAPNPDPVDSGQQAPPNDDNNDGGNLDPAGDGNVPDPTDPTAGADDDTDDPAGPSTPGIGGGTAIAKLIINPTKNPGSNNPIVFGSRSAGVSVAASRLSPVLTNELGEAVFTGLAHGPLLITLPDTTVTYDGLQRNLMYDIVINYSDDGVANVVHAQGWPLPSYNPKNNKPVRLAAGNSISSAITRNTMILYLEPGVFVGDVFVYRGGVMIIGSTGPNGELLSTIQGNIHWNNNHGKIRSVKIDGDIYTRHHNLVISHNQVFSGQIRGDNAVIVGNLVTGGPFEIYGNNALLINNNVLP